MIYSMSVMEDISNAISVGLRSFMGWLIAQIYSLIEYLYDILNYLSMAQILDNEYIKTIYSRIGLILGIFMTFKLVFSLVNSLISPDKLSDKKNGAAAIIQRSVIAIVLLGLTPAIFNEAFRLQRLFVGRDASDNVLYKLISNKPVNGDIDIGHVLASDLYLNFYTDNKSPKLNNGTIDTIYDTNDEYYDRFVKNDYDTIYNNLRDGKISFEDTIEYLSIRGTGTSEWVIEFNWLVLLIVGLVVLWTFIMYCIQVGVRVIQLAYLQLIAPVPILSYISDPNGTFKKWVSQCIATYLDLFFRLAIIYFVMTIVGEVLEQFNASAGVIFTSTGIGNAGFTTQALVMTFIILGLLLFAKKAPDLIKDLFPNLGGGAGKFNFGLKPSKEVGGLATFGIGAAAGAVGGLVTGIKYGDGIKGKLFGAFGGLGRGALGGMKTKGNPFTNASKGMAAQRAAAQRAYDRNHDGSDFLGRHGFRVNELSNFEAELQSYSDYDSYASIIDKETDKDSFVQYQKLYKDNFMRTGRTTTALNFVDSNTGRTISYNAGDRVSQSDMEAVIRHADSQIKKAKTNAIERSVDEYQRTGKSSGIVSAVMSAEQVRSKGMAAGYSGFSNSQSMNITTESAADIASRFNDNKQKAKEETGKIKNAGGQRNDAYIKAKASAKYNKK